MQFFIDFGIEATGAMIAVVGMVFLVSGIDDLFMTCVWLVWRAYRRLVFRKRHSELTDENLATEVEKPIAIMVPAWDESAVIGRMLRTTVERLKYSNYHIFVGIYPNDGPTANAVRAAAAENGNIHPVILNHNGPTTKADCLNGIMKNLPLYEADLSKRFEIFVIDDAEDVVPAYELSVINHLIPRKDIVQLAVFPLPVRWWEFTAGHYMDEFAQLHLKEMRVREWLTGSIPTAGVGCAFSRRIMDLAHERRGEYFHGDALTEDYELPLQLAKLAVGEAFYDSTVRHVQSERSPQDPHKRVRWVDEVPAIYEYFPRELTAAIHQKSRWVYGIAVQGWRNLGWRGGLAFRYMLMRDRKPLLTNIANMLGYMIVFFALVIWAIRWVWLNESAFPPVVPRDSWVWTVIYANLILMGIYLALRAGFTMTVYGPLQALLSIPRTVWGNVINFLATVRALGMFLRSRRPGAPPQIWEKTPHEYPDDRTIEEDGPRN